MSHLGRRKKKRWMAASSSAKRKSKKKRRGKSVPFWGAGGRARAWDLVESLPRNCASCGTYSQLRGLGIGPMSGPIFDHASACGSRQTLNTSQIRAHASEEHSGGPAVWVSKLFALQGRLGSNNSSEQLWGLNLGSLGATSGLTPPSPSGGQASDQCLDPFADTARPATSTDASEVQRLVESLPRTRAILGGISTHLRGRVIGPLSRPILGHGQTSY